MFIEDSWQNKRNYLGETEKQYKQLGNAKLSSLISPKLRNLLPVYIIKIYLLGNSKRIM